MDEEIDELIEKSTEQSMDIKYVVISNRGYDSEDIFYCGDEELMAFKRYKELPKNMNKEIVKATVKMCKIMGYEMIEKISVTEKIFP